MRRLGSLAVPAVARPQWARRFSGFSDSSDDSGFDLQSELAQVLQESAAMSETAATVTPPVATTSADAASSSSGPVVQLTKLSRPPAKFDLMTNSFAYEWKTTARHARKVIGPMREWASELKYRTGVHLEMDVTHPEVLESEGYATADDVELTVYVFGTDKGVQHSQPLMESAIQQDPAYVRLGVFRRPAPDAAQQEVEWLMLRRINRDNRPPDIPKISLKLPGKYTLFHENYKEAAIRTLFEETGITVSDPLLVFPSGYRVSTDPKYFWRVPVRYFVAEVPRDVHVLGPQTNPQMYMQGWDPRILRQSPDPIDREWARLADPATGCAWVPTSLIDELQRPLRGEDYMVSRYMPPPHSDLQDVIKFKTPPSM